ncbi:restriction endonuclease subunit S [Methylomonas koyamae]|uniref:restriction endonuclease subunit S n=1 Tax=Methylomonas koyamae TaxID=702114 RepID=UPI00112A6D0C|nr:restriction endonuclease subunit S [Methylomonas koyamae]TPQ24964.1 type I restriction endonuclease subunit R [Methylomonas koyamae]
MDAQQFLAEFGHIANAPGGVARLRELIIQLAISGRLVERIESEITASQAIEAAAELRRAYEEELDLRATRMHPPLHSKPFSVPDHWQWTRLEQICLYIQRGKGPKYVEKSSTHVISQKCVQWSGFDLSSARFVADDSLASYGKERFLCAGDLLWNSTGTGTAGRVAIYQPDESVTAVADSHVTVVRLANCSPRYLWCVIASPWVQSRIEPSHSDSLVSGTTQQVELNTSTARALPIPLPPIQEQSRIVAKVDELMALCDKLEAQQQARRLLQNKLRQATLQAVASATSPHELQTTWARLADNFGRLFHAPEDVVELRRLILDMAMRGHLVHQDAIEEPAVTLCAHIETKKRELSQVKKLKLQKSLSKIGEDEIPFDIPKGWEWIRLGQIAELINGDRGKNYPNKDEYVSVGIPWINTGHIEPDGTLTRHHMNFISRGKFDSLNSGKIEPGDLVYCLRGATFGKTAFVTPYKEGAIASSLMIIRPIISNLSRFLYYYLISPLGRNQISRFDNGTAQPNLSANSVGLFSYPLPPLQEQSRIADKIEQLMRVCDALELQLRHSTEVAGRLAIAAISILTGIAIEQKEEPMKAPQTELIAPLRLGTAPDIKTQAPLATILARQNGEMSAKDLWQRFGGEIDAFYAQLKTEVAHGWILEPAPAEMREKPTETVSA